MTKYRAGYKYQLAETYQVFTPIKPTLPIASEFISFDNNGLLAIRHGYAWDGASGPTWDTDNTITPSLVHDAFYQLLRLAYLPSWYRSQIDDYLDKMLEERGMWKLRRWYWMKGVSWFASGAADPENVKEVFSVT